MSYRIDHDEQIPKLIERLEREHRELDPKLDHILELSESGNLQVAESILLSISQVILRHSVEEEARIIQVIADNSKRPILKDRLKLFAKDQTREVERLLKLGASRSSTRVRSRRGFHCSRGSRWQFVLCCPVRANCDNVQMKV